MKTRRGVQICRTGTFKLSTGKHTFTKAQFEAAVRNARGRSAPTIGIGHTDKRWADVDASRDGEPALGRIENLRVSDDGELLLGDLVDMPNWFADALPSSFPRRSLEGPCDGDDLVITAVKVLGMKMPGVHTLEDLKGLVSDEGPLAVAAGADNEGRDFTVLLASDGPGPQWAPTPANDDGKVKVMNPKLLREALGLPDDATDEQVKTKFEEHVRAKALDATRVVEAAAAEGKFTPSRVPFWRERYERDPEGTRAALALLHATDPKILAAAARLVSESEAESRLRHQTRVALGLEERSNPSPLFTGAAPGPRVEAAAGARPQLTRTKHGTVLYGGVPTRYSERGVHQVFHNSEWLDVDEFERRGFTPADSALAIATTQQVGSAAARQALNEGLRPTAAFGVV